MKIKALMLMARRRQRLAAQHLRGDQFPVLTPRDWADLPRHHPLAD